MPKPRPSKLPWDARAAEILAGRAAVDPGELIDLIHEVNPTGRGRGAAETAARYALKSRLQSLLVTRFPADLEVTSDPNDPGVASLRHRYRRHDACHAVIAALDEDARSWVQRQLDLATGPESEPAPESKPAPAEAPPVDDEDDASAADLLAAGEEAQAAYDYERAGRCFSRAVAASGGSVAAAIAYLSFTVDAMAADEDALSLEARLPAATLAEPRVALLLAVAAARAGDEARALRHLAPARDPRMAEVLAILARMALAGGDAERAARHVRAAEAADPAHPELRALADGIAAARAVERAPREAHLAALLAEGRDDEALAEAEAILGRWPESEQARKAARRLEERRHEGAGRQHLAEGEAALGRGEVAVALELLQRALASPLPAQDRQRAGERVREAEALLREQAARAQVEHVVALLAEPDRARGLAAYVELDQGARSAVRARVSLPALGWLDLIPSARSGGRARAAVEAVLALSRASSLADKDLAAAAALIAPHQRILDEIPACQSITERARAAAAVERARRAAADLREAEEGLSGGLLDRARASLDRIDLRALSDDDRARVAALEAALGLAEQRRRDQRRFEQLRAAGAFRAARAAALALAEGDGGAERARWTAEAAAIAERVRARYALRAVTLSAGPELLHDPALSRLTRDASAWVADGGREMVLCNTANAWAFLRFVDIETGRVTRGVRFALDASLNDPRITVHEGGVTLTGRSGLFEIDVAAEEIAQRFERNWSVDHGLTFGDGIQPEGTRLLWGRYGIDEEAVKIVDLDGGPAVKTFTEVAGPWSVVGTKPPRLLTRKAWYDENIDDHAYTITAHEAAGAPIGRIEVRRSPDAAVRHPSGAGMVVLCHDYAGEGVTKVSLLEISERFDLVAAPVLEAEGVTWPEPQAQMAVALDAGLVFVVLIRHAAPHATLVALRNAGPGQPLIEHYRVAVPLRTTLAHDRSGRRAFALVEHPGGLSITPLGPEPPVDLPESGPHHILQEAFEHVNWCGCPSGSDAVHVYLSLRRLSAAERSAAVAAKEEAAAGDPHKLMELFHALLDGDWLDAAAGVLARAEASHPEDPEVRIAPFAMLVARRAWGDIATALDAGPERFQGRFIQHYHHLLATAHARLGAVDEALRHLKLAESLPPAGCTVRLGPLRRALESLPGSVEDLAFDRPVSAQLVAILFAADHRMEEGDPAGAIAILDRPLTWDLREVHSLGRVAAAYLALHASSEADRFKKALALATFVECMDDDTGGRRREGLAPGLAWPQERLTALRHQAVAWLEADQGTARTASWTRDLPGDALPALTT